MGRSEVGAKISSANYAKNGSTIHILGEIRIFYYMQEYQLELIIKCFHIVTISETLCFCRGNSLFLRQKQTVTPLVTVV